MHFPDVILGVYTEDELRDSQPPINVTPKEQSAERLDDTRPVLTEKQADAAIKKLKAGQVSLEQITGHYIVPDELLNYIKAQTEVIEHDPV